MSDKDITTFYEDLPNNLPDNSSKAREEKKQQVAREGKRADKVVRGKVKTKKNEVRKWTDIFFSEDTANVGNYIVMDVLVPSIKKAIYDIVVNSLDMSLFGGRGGSGGGRRTISDSKASFRDYNSVSRRDRDERSYSRSSRDHVYEDIVFESRADAKEVLEGMDECMEQYDFVRVADMYDLAGLTCEHTLNNYGWTDIRSAKIVPVGGGYIIRMPRALPKPKDR